MAAPTSKVKATPTEKKAAPKPKTEVKAVPAAKKPAAKPAAPVKKKPKLESNKELMYRMQDSVSKVMS